MKRSLALFIDSACCPLFSFVVSAADAPIRIKLKVACCRDENAPDGSLQPAAEGLSGKSIWTRTCGAIKFTDYSSPMIEAMRLRIDLAVFRPLSYVRPKSKATSSPSLPWSSTAFGPITGDYRHGQA